MQQIFQHLGGRLEQIGDLSSIGLEPGDILARQVKDAGDAFHILGRNLKDLFEGLYFVPGHLAVGLGHFRAQGDDADGKGDLPGTITAFTGEFARDIAQLVRGLLRHAAEQSAQRAIEGATNTTNNSIPYTHAADRPSNAVVHP